MLIVACGGTLIHHLLPQFLSRPYRVQCREELRGKNETPLDQIKPQV
ncbi:hypothetical protein ACEYW6_29105 [Nostoc sp. UIC 10607]